MPAARREASKGSQQTIGLSHPVRVARKQGKGQGSAGQGRAARKPRSPKSASLEHQTYTLGPWHPPAGPKKREQNLFRPGFSEAASLGPPQLGPPEQTKMTPMVAGWGPFVA